MRVDDLKSLVGGHATKRFLEKRGFAAPIAGAIGVQAPDLARRTVNRYYDVERALNRASRQQLDESVKQAAPAPSPSPSNINPAYQSFVQGVTKQKKLPTSWGDAGGALAGSALGSVLHPILAAPGNAISERIKAYFGPKPPSTYQQIKGRALETLGNSIGEAGASLLKDLASKAMSSVGSIGQNAARAAIVQVLKQEDSVLAGADDKALMEAYHTMVRFAPTLSTDKNAVRSFLRQATMSGSGPDYMAIKLLADSEHAVTGKQRQ
jgi:hypothetical protein